MDAGWVGGMKSSASPPTAVGGGAVGNATPATTPAAVRVPVQINEARHAASTNTTIPVQRTVPFTMNGQLPRCDALSVGGVVFVGGRHPSASRSNIKPLDVGGPRYTHCADFGYVCNEHFCNASGELRQHGPRHARPKLLRLPPDPSFGASGVAAQTIHLETVRTTVSSKGAVLGNALTAGSVVLNVPDVTFLHARHLELVQQGAANGFAHREDKERRVLVDAAVNATQHFQRQGILPMDEGPFLRGCGGIASGGVALPELPGRYGAEAGVASRHAGDDAAFDAFDEELRSVGIFDWTPDGILLSRDGESVDALEGDVQHPLPGHLFNVAVQGSAHTTSWTSDLPGLDETNVACQPGDEVFIAVIGDVQWVVEMVETPDEDADEDAEATAAATRVAVEGTADAAAKGNAGTVLPSKAVSRLQALLSALASAHAERGPKGRGMSDGKRQRGSVDVLTDPNESVRKMIAQLEGEGEGKGEGSI